MRPDHCCGKEHWIYEFVDPRHLKHRLNLCLCYRIQKPFDHIPQPKKHQSGWVHNDTMAALRIVVLLSLNYSSIFQAPLQSNLKHPSNNFNEFYVAIFLFEIATI